MIPTITKLLIKIDQLEWDIAQIKKELEQLQHPLMKSLTPEEYAEARKARIKAERERLRPTIERVFGKPRPKVKRLTAEELQQLSIEAGINPEDNLFSSGIIEERERRSR